MEVYEENEEYKCSSEGAKPGEDSDMDPDYSFLEETREKLSGLSIMKKSKLRCSAVNDQEEMEENVEDFELVQKIVESGEVERLKLEQCKVYLRKNRLRLTGNKNTLILRIKEHLQISNGGGEKKYPVSSFVLNCKGDACTGDVIMFKHNVYEMFNLASRSASGPPCGKRIVAGRIVKESYGAAKQQHTFTIEVLWSKGEKPLPPLHPLLIKGRNLYCLLTMRQKWEDEGERRKALMEKHTRGSQARSDRETRIHVKEMGKQLKANSVLTGGPKRNQYQLNVQSREKAEILINDRKQVTQRPVINGEFREVQNQRDENFHANYRQSIGRYPNKTNDGRPFQNNNVYCPASPSQRQGWMKQQMCPYYPHGRCYYGDNCRFLHEMRPERDRTWDHGHRKFENAGMGRL